MDNVVDLFVAKLWVMYRVLDSVTAKVWIMYVDIEFSEKTKQGLEDVGIAVGRYDTTLHCGYCIGIVANPRQTY